jgi:hypothetical protein
MNYSPGKEEIQKKQNNYKKRNSRNDFNKKLDRAREPKNREKNL